MIAKHIQASRRRQSLWRRTAALGEPLSNEDSLWLSDDYRGGGVREQSDRQGVEPLGNERAVRENLLK